MLGVDEARDQVLNAVRQLGTVRAPLLETLGRVLAEDITADIPLPPFDNSAVDGYAVRAADTQGASERSPVILREIGEVAAGQTPQIAVTPGTACRIMTGAPLPPGADAIVMVEDTRREQTAGGALLAVILEGARPDQHVRRAGEDVVAGACVLRTGMRIRPAEIAMLATMGRNEVAVVRAPSVAVFSTGDEVVDIGSGEPPPPGKIRDSNRYTLAAMVLDAGANLHTIAHIPDDPAATAEALLAASDAVSGADVIITAGGVSMGDRDYVKLVLERLGTLTLWKVAMKPGKPLAFGHIGRTHFFGLPGNPISAMVTFELFARPALKKMAGGGEQELSRRTVTAAVAEAIPHTPGRREYVRAFTTWRNGRFEAAATGRQGSSILRSATAANSLLIVPTDSPGLAAGDMAEIILID